MSISKRHTRLETDVSDNERRSPFPIQLIHVSTAFTPFAGSDEEVSSYWESEDIYPRFTPIFRMGLERNRRRFLQFVGTSGAVALTGCLGSSADVAEETRTLLSNGVLHSSPACVCCEQYASYVADRDISLSVQKT